MIARALIAAVLLWAIPGPARAQLQWRAEHLPDGGSARGASTSRTEAAMIQLAYQAMTARMAQSERAGLREAVRAEFTRLHQRHPDGLPSLLEASHLVSQSAGGFEALVAEPEGDTDVAVVFLHGFGGNALVPCAIVAEAAARAGAMTICPSIGGAGHWRGAQGARILRATLDWLHDRRGAQTVVLAGLSNGGIGASRLAAHFRTRLAGVILLSGAAPGTRTDLPALVIHGDRDTMTGLGAARAFARRSPHAELVVIEGNHFVLLHERAVVQDRMTAWLRARTE